MSNSLLELLVELENSLHMESVRKSKEKLNELLHDDFKEIGASGTVYNKNKIIEGLLNETPYKINASDFELRLLSKDIAQLTYKTKSTANNNLIRMTLRSSIWKKEGTKWKMIFHQGTVVDIHINSN